MRKWLRGLFGGPELGTEMILMFDERLRLIRREIEWLTEELEEWRRENAELRGTLESMERERESLNPSRLS